MTADSASSVLTERRGRTLVITLNRPRVRNAIDQSVASGLARALDELDDQPALAVGVITGSGRGFCSGMDLKAFLAEGEPVVEGRGFAGIVQRPATKPLIAAIEGFALAGGLEVALACDLIVAAEGALLGLPEVKRSLVATGGGLRRLPRRLPFGLALELALTGESITGRQAYERGLINRVAPAGETLARALELADMIAAGGPLAVAATKRIMYEQLGWSESESWDRQAEIARPVEESDDAREGSVAFSEKRAPIWRGR
ncbi:MAG TPA: crotonase/enoyl-CoA hydratase family protein [Solirubrobacteraceae bacterium]|nr:crotonase/enoyl-CoA hydratase family protein [Solirubrobacteraceae bacterium]